MARARNRPDWEPGKNMGRPTMDQARSHDAHLRESPETLWPSHEPHVYAQMGWRSAAPLEQEEFGDVEGAKGWGEKGVERPRIDPLPRWEDMPERKVNAAEARASGGELTSTGNRATQESVRGRLAAEYGQTPEAMGRRQGFLMDTAKERAHEQRRGDPEGQHFYGRTERAKISEAARRQNVSFDTMTTMAATVSPQMPWSREGEDVNLEIAETVAEHMASGRPGSPKTSTGLPAQIGKAMIAHGIDAPITRDLNPIGLKVQSFEQNFMQPYDRRGRTTVDTHAITGMTGLPKERAEGMLHNVTGGYEAADHVQRQEAERRGLVGTEGQSVAWHQQKHLNESDLTGRSAHDTVMAKSFSATGDQRETHGQQTVFGGEERIHPSARATASAKVERLYDARPKQNANLSVEQWRPGEPL
jgi:hypothetical protein